MPFPALLAPLVAAAAPTLAKHGLDLLSRIFAGGVDQATEEVAALIERQTGIPMTAVAEEHLTPEQIQRLQAFEAEHQAKLLMLELDRLRLELQREQALLADVADARAMQQAALASHDPFVRRFVYWYASAMTGASFLYFTYASFIHDYHNGAEATQIITTILGFLLGIGMGSIVQFLFGSSAGSKSKEEKLVAPWRR
ncbi:MAG TPA: hypothetical protein VNP04_21470 [Alphaproteobacteria bacterium]|nr:hypothetical protein [Alphaproteobacteria bacterium]